MGLLRSTRWLVGESEVALSSRVALRSVGLDISHQEQRPVIGIANSASDLNPCNLPLRELAAAAKRGIIAAGGLPVEFPTMSLGEDLMKPTAMLYRNLLAMEIEETIRSNPLDGVVLLANCDKTVPAVLMGALSADLPAIVVTGGARPAPCFEGKRIGTGTDLWRMWDRRRSNQMSDEEWENFEEAISCGLGACNTMGTASTMALVVEALGMSLSGSATIPAGDPRGIKMAFLAGERVVGLVSQQKRPSSFVTSAAIENAAKVISCVGGSTNAVIHLAAIAGRPPNPLSLADLSRWASQVPVLVDVEPTGAGLIQDLDLSGGLPTVLRVIASRLNLQEENVSGETLAEITSKARGANGVVRDLDSPLRKGGGMVVLWGNLAPDGAVIRTSTASEELFSHQGRAVVFDGYEAMLNSIDDPALGITADSVLVLRGCGPLGGPAMPEWGMIPIPGYLAATGVTDMVRISDARMSGTSFGTVVLHVAPEAAIGGPLAHICSGDTVRLDVNAGVLEVLLSREELESRAAKWSPPVFSDRRGWPYLYRKHVMQAPQGCDFDFLCAIFGEGNEFVEPVVGRS